MNKATDPRDEELIQQIANIGRTLHERGETEKSNNLRLLAELFRHAAVITELRFVAQRLGESIAFILNENPWMTDFWLAIVHTDSYRGPNYSVRIDGLNTIDGRRIPTKDGSTQHPDLWLSSIIDRNHLDAPEEEPDERYTYLSREGEFIYSLLKLEYKKDSEHHAVLKVPRKDLTELLEQAQHIQPDNIQQQNQIHEAIFAKVAPRVWKYLQEETDWKMYDPPADDSPSEEIKTRPKA